MSLPCKLVPGQYWGYEYGLFFRTYLFLTLVWTWIHYKRQRSNQPKPSLTHTLWPTFWLFLHYSTNLSCPEFRGHRQPQKRTNRGLSSRRSFSPFPLTTYPFFSLNFLSPPPTPSLIYTKQATEAWHFIILYYLILLLLHKQIKHWTGCIRVCLVMTLVG